MHFWSKTARCQEKNEIPQFLQPFLSQGAISGLSQPLSFGLVSGFCSGYFAKKVGRAAVIGTGLVFAIFQVSAQAGYLTVHWLKIENDWKKFTGMKPGDPQVSVDEAAKWFTNKTGIASGAFTAGFILGIKKG